MEKIFQTIWEMSLFAVPVILILAICSSTSSGLSLKSSGETLWGKMAVSGVACGGDTALRADTAEPAGANGDNAGTGAFCAERHKRGACTENTGLFRAEGAE